MHKENRTDIAAVLDAVGRDQPDQKQHLIRDEERLIWELDHAEKELWKEPPDPLLGEVAKLLAADRPEWQGSATELIDALNLTIQPNVLTKKLNVLAGHLLNDWNVRYENIHSRSGSRITLTLIEAA